MAKKKKKSFDKEKKLILVVIILAVVCVGLKLYNNEQIAKRSLVSSEKKITASGAWFRHNLYQCRPGETIITQVHSNYNNLMTSVYSSNSKIATVKRNHTLKCLGCDELTIKCKTSGKVNIVAVTKNGTKTNLPIGVKKGVNTILYAEKKYECTEGGTLSTRIYTNGAQIKSYGTGNKNIATIKRNRNNSGKKNVIYVDIACKKAGSTTLTAKSAKGTKINIPLRVNVNKGTVKFAKTSITCSPGQTVKNILVWAYGGTNPRVKSYYSEDMSIATVTASVGQPKCPNCKSIDVKCLKSGDVKLKAINGNGGQGQAYVHVDNNVGSISFDRASYTCKKGESFETVVTASYDPVVGVSTVRSYYSSDSSIADVEKSSNQVKCINCLNLLVTCKKAGNVSLTAISSRGAKKTVPLTVK